MAHKVFHRSLTAGVALAGAGAIAFSALPVVPTQEAVAPQSAADVAPLAAARVVTTEVEYASLVRSLEILVAGAVATVQESFATFNGDIPALWNQVGIGVPGALWEDPLKLPWSHSLLGEALFAPVAPFVVGPFVDAVAEVLAQTFSSHADAIREELTKAVDHAFARLIGPVISAIGATGKVHQEIYLAGVAGNAPGQWLAILRSPETVMDGFLNGGYGDISALITGEVGGERIAAPGVSTPWGQYPVDRSVNVPAGDDVSSARVPGDDALVPFALNKGVAEDVTEGVAEESDVIETVAVSDRDEAETVVAERTPAPDVSSIADDTDEDDKSDKAEEPADAEEVASDPADESDDADKNEKTENVERTEKAETVNDAAE